MKKIHLEPPELYYAACVGLRRRLDSIARHLKPKYGYEGDAWSTDIEGSAAELAAAKATNQYWAGGVSTFKAGDVGGHQVRSTPIHKGHLILHQEDADDEIFILVTGVAPAFNVIGWLVGREGKLPKYWSTRNPERPAFWIPQSDLHHLDTLPIDQLVSDPA